MVLSFLDGDNKFNYRVAGIIIRNNHILVCREDDQDYVFLPGGRVEFSEPSDEALKREIKEELGCKAKLGGLLFCVENFFDLEGERFHEIGKYYLVTLPDEFLFETEKPDSSEKLKPCMITHDEGHVLKFYWVAIKNTALKEINLLPLWLRANLEGLPTKTVHLIVDERRN